KKRLRPILITSLTTILGMLPIALGLGEGGKILRPLGLAVSGGLGVSMLLTLVAIPVLETWYLEYKYKDRFRDFGSRGMRTGTTGVSVQETVLPMVAPPERPPEGPWA